MCGCFTGVVQPVNALPGGQRRGLALPLQGGVVLQTRACSLLLWTFLWRVVTGEGES